MEVSEPKWINSILNIIEVNSLRLGNLLLHKEFSIKISKKKQKKNSKLKTKLQLGLKKYFFFTIRIVNYFWCSYSLHFNENLNNFFMLRRKTCVNWVKNCIVTNLITKWIKILFKKSYKKYERLKAHGLETEASEPKWVNSNCILYWVNSLRLGGFHRLSNLFSCFFSRSYFTFPCNSLNLVYPLCKEGIWL